MQRSLIITAALASVGAGADAFAQSSVNVYGRLNVTVAPQSVCTV